MKKVILFSQIILIMLIAFSTHAIAQVKHYIIEEEILEHNQLPLNPYPPFGLLTGYITYPFQFYGSKNFSIDKRKIKIFVAENEYLKIGLAPDYGGRLWFVYDKIRNKEVIHRNYKEAKFYNSGMGYQYLGGGLELNIPNAHSHTNARKRDCIIKENSDGSVSLIMSNTEKIGRLHWSVAFTLPPGEARIKQDVRLANESPLEERYPIMQPGKPYLYYAQSTTGIYNIYRRNLQTGQTELLTNVTGGAVMPAVNKNGQLVYALYDSLGYHIYRIDHPRAVDTALAVYQKNYLQTVPRKNFDNTVPKNVAIHPYKQTFGVVHILPRIMIDYGTVKPGAYIVSDDILGKFNLIGAGAINKDFDYDLYGYFQMNIFKPSLFLEVYNTSANIADTLGISRGGYGLTYHRNINFDLTEARAGLQYYPKSYIKLVVDGVWRRYNAKIDYKKLYDKVKKRWEPPFTFHYNYLKGFALEVKAIADMIHEDRNKHIAPSGGRYLSFRYSLEYSDFLKDFAISSTGLSEVYTNYTYNQLETEWEEYFKNPLLKSHTFSVGLKAGYIDRKVDTFFDLYAGGLIGMKGYSYFSIEGRHKLIGTVTYRFPVWQNIDKIIGHIYFDKLYFGLFFDYGNAWNYSDKRFSIKNFKKDVGFQLRLSTFSYSMFPTRFFAEAVYPLDKISNYDGSRKKIISYPQEWRFYFGALYDFDLRERAGSLGRMVQRWF